MCVCAHVYVCVWACKGVSMCGGLMYVCVGVCVVVGVPWSWLIGQDQLECFCPIGFGLLCRSHRPQKALEDDVTNAPGAVPALTACGADLALSLRSKRGLSAFLPVARPAVHLPVRPKQAYEQNRRWLRAASCSHADLQTCRRWGARHARLDWERAPHVWRAGSATSSA